MFDVDRKFGNSKSILEGPKGGRGRINREEDLELKEGSFNVRPLYML